MKYLLAFLLLCCSLAWAKKKPSYTYQDGVLISFRTETAGSLCSQTANTSGTVHANTDDAGNTDGNMNATTTGYSNCSNTRRALYTVKSGNNILVLSPALSEKAAVRGMATMGWSFLFTKNSVLAYQLPGTHFLLRADGKHYFVKLGKRESMYEIVEAK